MINIPENYQIIILGIVLLLLGYYALVLNKKVEGFGCGWSDPGACLREIRDLKNKLKNAIPSIDSVFNPIKDWFNNNLLNKINDIKNKISDLPEKAKNKIL